MSMENVWLCAAEERWVEAECWLSEVRGVEGGAYELLKTVDCGRLFVELELVEVGRP